VCWRSNGNKGENCTAVANEESRRRSTVEIEYRTMVLYSVTLYLSDSSTTQLLADADQLESEIARSIDSDAIAENVTVVSIVLTSKTSVDVEMVLCPVYCQNWFTGCGTGCFCEESLSRWIGMGNGCMTKSSCPTPDETFCSEHRDCSSLSSDECEDASVAHCIWAPHLEAPFCRDNCTWENQSHICEEIGKGCDENSMICMDIEENYIQIPYDFYPIIGCAVFVICYVVIWVSYKYRVSRRSLILTFPSSLSSLSNSPTREKIQTYRVVQSEVTKREGEKDFPGLPCVGTTISGEPDSWSPSLTENYDGCPIGLSKNKSGGGFFMPYHNATKIASAPLGSIRRASPKFSPRANRLPGNEGLSQGLPKFQLSVHEITEMDPKKIIGEGSFGVVVKGVYAGMVVAIKRFKTQWSMMSQKEKADFRAEIYNGIELNHENIIRHYGYIEEPLSVVMEFCSHGSLKDYFSTVNVELTSKESWTDKMLKWTNSAARGIDYLHSKGIVHRDIAARNLLLNKHLEIRVSDFGMARLLQIQDCDLYGSDQTISTVGPLKWMSPESLRDREYSFKTDVYSFGVTAWEIFTMCSEPYGELGPLKAALQAVENNRRPDLEKILYQNVLLLDLLTQCWHKNPEKRPLMEKVMLIIQKIIVETQPGENKPTYSAKPSNPMEELELISL